MFHCFSNTPALPQPRSPPPPVQPGAFTHGKDASHINNYQQLNRLVERDRRSSASTHLTDRMERIESMYFEHVVSGYKLSK